MIRPTSGQCSFGPDACRGKAASPASLSLGRLAEIGPLRPAPAHSQMSLREVINVRLRGGIHRAPDAGGLVY